LPDERVSAFDAIVALEAAAPRRRRPWAVWLLVVPVLAVLVPPLYARDHPNVAGIPFFVWYQIVAVVFGGGVTGLVYVLRGTEGSFAAASPDDAEEPPKL
jgi:uncharacterized protein DUF3311